MSPILTLPTSFIIGHPPTPGLTPFAAIRAPGFLPSGVSEFLLGTQWVYWLIALGVGCIVAYVSTRRGDKRLMRAGIGVLALTVLWVGLSLLFDTPHERLRAAHNNLLRAAEARNASGVVAFLAPDFQSAALRISRPEDRTPSIERILQAYTLKSNRITSFYIDDRGRSARTNLVVLTDIEGIGFTKTRWVLEWSDEPNADWQLVAADLTAINDVPVPNFNIPFGR